MTDKAEKIKDVDLTEFAKLNYKEYGTAVLEDRAFPDYRDGLIPVTRHLLWAAYEMGINSKAKLVKSARVVGDTMGRYHPHGDRPIYGALVNMTNANRPVAMFFGGGNYGSLSDKGYAAMRYTETRLSKFTDEVVFNKFYTPVLDMVPNYDGSGKEPLIVHALLPLALINGVFGIAPGATSHIPSCDYKSLLKTLFLIYSGEELTPKLLYKNLKFRTTYGGVEEPPKGEEAKENRKSLFVSPEGKVTLQSVMTYDAAKRTVTVEGFARDSEMESLIPAFLDLEGVSAASDDSNTKDYYGKLTVVFKKGLTDKQYEKLLAFTRETLSSRKSYILNFTERYIDETGQGQARVKPMSLTETFKLWVDWRIELERRACAYWIKEDQKQIRKLELLMIAVDNRKIIIQSLDKDCSQEDLNKWLGKKLKITAEEASFIYDLRVKQLRKLEKKSLMEQKKAVETNKKKLEQRQKKPQPHMAEQLKGWANLGVTA